MIYRPWPLVLIALIQMLEPFTKSLYLSFLYKISVYDLVKLQLDKGSYLQIFSFFFLFPISGYALYKVKNWSLPVFVTTQVLVVIDNITYFKHLQLTHQYVIFYSFILFGLLNFIVTIYFLLPSVRVLYLDKSLRWWEPKYRYQINVPIQIDEKTSTNILNISETGCFVKKETDLEIGSIVIIKSEDPIWPLSLQAKVIHKFFISQQEGYGLQFVELDRKLRSKIRERIHHFEKLKLPRHPPRRQLRHDFFQWLWKLLRTGEGLIPKVRARH